MLALSVEWWKAVRARVNELANKKRFEGTSSNLCGAPRRCSGELYLHRSPGDF